MSELDCKVKPCALLDPFFSSFTSFGARNVEAELDPATPTPKLASGFLFSGALLSTNLPLALASRVVFSSTVAGVAERDSNKLSPQLPISANASWPRLNLGGANEYLFFFFAETAGDIDNGDMLNSSGGNEIGPSSSSSSSASPPPRPASEVTPETPSSR